MFIVVLKREKYQLSFISSFHNLFRVVIAVGILITFPLQLYMSVNIIKSYVMEVRPRCNPETAEYLTRLILVFTTFILAQVGISHYNLSLYTSLVAPFWPALALMAPAVIDTVIEMEGDRRTLV